MRHDQVRSGTDAYTGLAERQISVMWLWQRGTQAWYLSAAGTGGCDLSLQERTCHYPGSVLTVVLDTGDGVYVAESNLSASSLSAVADRFPALLALRSAAFAFAAIQRGALSSDMCCSCLSLSGDSMCCACEQYVKTGNQRFHVRRAYGGRTRYLVSPWNGALGSCQNLNV